MNQLLLLAVIHVPLASLTGLFVYLYLQEKKLRMEAHREKLQLMREHNITLEGIREAQRKREAELSEILTGYGNNVLEGVHRLTHMAEQLRQRGKTGTKNLY